MQLLAPRVAQGSRKCEGVQEWWASCSSLSQMAYLLTSLELEEIVLTCLGFRSTNSQWQMVAMLKPFQDTSYKPISGPTTAAVQAAATVGSRASRVSWDSGLHCHTATVYWPISLLTVWKVAWRPHSFACGDKSFLVVFFPWGLLEAKLPHLQTFSRLVNTAERDSELWLYLVIQI